jgi:hypothetical protein
MLARHLNKYGTSGMTTSLAEYLVALIEQVKASSSNQLPPCGRTVQNLITSIDL